MKSLEQKCKEAGIYQYKVAARDLTNKGYYRRGRSQNPIEGTMLHWDVYVLVGGDVEMLCRNITAHRARVVIRAYKSGTIKQVNPAILDNYIHNGYTTRRGLFADYSSSKIERIKLIAQSHADYLGCECGNSSYDHQARVRLRNS